MFNWHRGQAAPRGRGTCLRILGNNLLVWTYPEGGDRSGLGLWIFPVTFFEELILPLFLYRCFCRFLKAEMFLYSSPAWGTFCPNTVSFCSLSPIYLCRAVALLTLFLVCAPELTVGSQWSWVPLALCEPVGGSKLGISGGGRPWRHEEGTGREGRGGGGKRRQLRALSRQRVCDHSQPHTDFPPNEEGVRKCNFSVWLLTDSLWSFPSGLWCWVSPLPCKRQTGQDKWVQMLPGGCPGEEVESNASAWGTWGLVFRDMEVTSRTLQRI